MEVEDRMEIDDDLMFQKLEAVPLETEKPRLLISKDVSILLT